MAQGRKASPEISKTLERWRKPLLICGIGAGLLEIAMTPFVGRWWSGYSLVSQTPSELSAIGAPTRLLRISLSVVYDALMIAFGWVVWRSFLSNRALRAVGLLLIVQTAFGVFWPPMHQRSVLAAAAR